MSPTISLSGFRAAIGTATANGIVYNYVAVRYDGYGVHVLLYLDDEGCPKVIKWQDYGMEVNPSIQYDLNPTLT